MEDFYVRLEQTRREMLGDNIELDDDQQEVEELDKILKDNFKTIGILKDEIERNKGI